MTRASWEHREYHNETHLAATSIAAMPVHRNKQEDIPWQEALIRSGKIKPLISYDPSVGIDKNDQQKQRSRHDTWNMRHARNTCSTHNTGELTSSNRDTVPRQKDKREQQQQQQQNTMLFWWIS
jgi:hypothetical protein